MIFATVGTQLPFDRLIESLDKWARKRSNSICFAQTGGAGAVPRHMNYAAHLTPSQFATHVAGCKVIVSHAGMGTILTALSFKKPIIIMPRLAAYGEHRNDHQLATVESLYGRAGIYTALDQDALHDQLNHLSELTGAAAASDCASPELLNAVRTFVAGQGQCHA